jgi:hypothetical protein
VNDSIAALRFIAAAKLNLLVFCINKLTPSMAIYFENQFATMANAL